MTTGFRSSLGVDTDSKASLDDERGAFAALF